MEKHLQEESMIAYKKLNMENFRVKKALNDNEMKM
jgi:hypothetical protein